LSSVVVDVANGGQVLTGYWTIALPIAIGTVIGAQLGARLSRRVGSVWIVRLLAAALGLVGARLVFAGLSG
jgi:uncharacterized membrane protein YfcA